MDELTKFRDREIQQFDSTRYRLTQAALDFGIEEAKRIKDWPALERAVDGKIEEQRKFVAWWKANVSDEGGRPSKTGPRTPTGISVKDATNLTGLTKQRVSDIGKRLAKLAEYRKRLLGAAYHAAMLQEVTSQLVQQSLSNEHYTPRRYIEAAMQVLGGIDLDPASCAEANASIGASRYFTVEDNGLGEVWQGRIWLNPPYGGLAGDFVAKFMQEYKAGRITGVILVNAHCTDTEWFQPLWDGVLCFTDHRINFYGDVERSGSTHGSVFVYFGPDPERFAHQFSKFGSVVARVCL